MAKNVEQGLMNLGKPPIPPHGHGANEATADISKPAPEEVPALGGVGVGGLGVVDVVRVNGTKRVLARSSKQAPTHASGKKSTELIISVHGCKRRGRATTLQGHRSLCVAATHLITLAAMTRAFDQEICP